MFHPAFQKSHLAGESACGPRGCVHQVLVPSLRPMPEGVREPFVTGGDKRGLLGKRALLRG